MLTEITGLSEVEKTQFCFCIPKVKVSSSPECSEGAFQGVKATSDTTPNNCDTGISNQQQALEKTAILSLLEFSAYFKVYKCQIR